MGRAGQRYAMRGLISLRAGCDVPGAGSICRHKRGSSPLIDTFNFQGSVTERHLQPALKWLSQTLSNERVH